MSHRVLLSQLISAQGILWLSALGLMMLKCKTIFTVCNAYLTDMLHHLLLVSNMRHYALLTGPQPG